MFDRLHSQAASGNVAANATAAMVLQQLGHYIRQAAPGEGLPCHCLFSLRLSRLGCLNPSTAALLPEARASWLQCCSKVW